MTMTVEEALAVFDGIYDGDIAGVDELAGMILSEEVRRLRALVEWQPIETAPRDRLIDILINGETRWCDCYYDQICDQWRTSRPSGHLIFVPARSATHWRPIGPGPGGEA